MDTIIEVTARKQFNRVDFYPSNALAHKFCALLGKTNLPKDAILKLKDIGYEVKEVHEAII